ncbi:MAG TPA: NFACT RNA binding domain-containing protein, partial [Chthonomonadaceae bacterium]|nr:NFACT RNA binding domain-containing protein [Chthonomonadaceae bacterium]
RNMDANASPKSGKVPFDSLTLRAVVWELQSRLVGGQVQEVRQPDPTEIWLSIRHRGESHYLTLSADARFARVHLMHATRKNAPTPPTFCMALRKYLEGGHVLSVRQRDFDRIFEMQVGFTTDAGSPATVTLIAELMGKHSNLILLDAEGRIIDAAKRISLRVNRVRQTLPSLPYQLPPQTPGQHDPFAPNALEPLLAELPEGSILRPDELAERLMALYSGMSPFLARELSRNRAQQAAPLQEAWERIIGAASRNEYAPMEISFANGRLAAYPFPTVQAPIESQKAIPDLNAALDKVYQQESAWAEFEAATGDLRSRLERETKHLEKQKLSVERTLQEAHRAEEYKQAGELLLGNLWQIETGMTSVTVQDYYSAEQGERTIALDAKLTPQENAKAYFRRYRKARDGQERALERGIEIEAKLERLAEVKARFAELQERGVEATLDIRELQGRLLTEGLLREQEKEREEERQSGGPDFAGHKISRVTTPEGYEIFIGETATANDYLTTRLSASNDIWLHVRAAPSAHVIIRTHGKPDAVPRSVLEQAALLCARHSNQKHSSLVPVDYTLKKYVRKPRGAAPGSVLIQQEKTLHVTP